MGRRVGSVAALLLALAVPVRAQQQGLIQISSSTQVTSGDPLRVGTGEPVQPDLLIGWISPAFAFGRLEVEFGITRRGDQAVPGRTYVALRDVRLFGLDWGFQAGDSWLSPSLSAYRFSNLFAPAVTFRGGSVSAIGPRTAVDVTAGRVTALRNIFGSDPEPLGQTLGLARVRHRVTPRIELNARAHFVRTTDLAEFTYYVADSDGGSAGATLTATSSLRFVVDAGYFAFRRRGADTTERGPSGLLGALWSHKRGWLQINAQRFSPGDFPVLNYQYRDQEGAFAAGEFELSSRARAFGGGHLTRTNLDPDASAAGSPVPPRTTTERVYGGLRLRLAGRSYFTVRREVGDRQSAPVGPGNPAETDTGVSSVEWQSVFGRWNLSGRYQRRDNVDRVGVAGSFTQQDASARVHWFASSSIQLFAAGSWSTRDEEDGGRTSFWQADAGGQFRVPRSDLWLRVEGTAGESADLASGLFAPRQSLNLGLNGRLTNRWTLALDVFADRVPLTIGDVNPWAQRSTLRVTYTIPAGAVRVPAGTVGEGSPGARGRGTVAGLVFADWNRNGARDAGEEALPGIGLLLGDVRVASGPSGEFEFAQAPVGTVTVALDAGAVPVDYELPAEPRVAVEVARNRESRVAFALVPVGSVSGRVYRDLNGSRALDEGDEPIDDAVIVLDGGARSELVRGGGFRFDAVAVGPHQLELLLDSLPSGAAIVGDHRAAVEIGRDELDASLAFLVDLESRPEIRRVFPAGAEGRATRPVERPVPIPPAPAGPPAARRPAAGPAPPVVPASGPVDLQVAAMSRLERAQALLGSLRARGFDAWVLQPPPGARAEFYRVRAGAFASPADALRGAAAIAEATGLSPFVVDPSQGRLSPLRVQVAALMEEDAARALAARLASQGHAAYVLSPRVGGDGLFRVRVGEFETEDAARAEADALQRLLGARVWITRDQPGGR